VFLSLASCRASQRKKTFSTCCTDVMRQEPFLSPPFPRKFVLSWMHKQTYRPNPWTSLDGSFSPIAPSRSQNLVLQVSDCIIPRTIMIGLLLQSVLTRVPYCSCLRLLELAASELTGFIPASCIKVLVRRSTQGVSFAINTIPMTDQYTPLGWSFSPDSNPQHN
jgi:hypothetical protein